MTTVLLLAPGDVIKDSTRELKERGIQIKVVDWNDEKKSGERTENGDSRAARGGGGTATEETENRVGVESGGKSSGTRNEGGERGSVEGSRKRELPDLGIQRKDHGSDRGFESQVKSVARKFQVLSREIAEVIREKFGQEVGVYKGGGLADEKILFLDSHVLKEIGLGKEAHAQQREAKKELDRWLKSTNNINPSKQKRKNGRKGKQDSEDNDNVDTEKGDRQQLAEPSEVKTDGKDLIEDVLSYKKLEDLIGKRDVKEEKFGAVRSSVRLVSNDIEDVKKASAYFTCPTGDTSWKNVAREAAKQDNIMAYVGQSEDPKIEFLHLIDHL
ncbi:VP6 [Eubenangee virus]|uniref:VP6 n=1 Tax=Eubenangee virus TaxID=40056 RepID=H9ZXS0_9REOV|nr:VP6 [Eubenangee virus]AFH41517.1 VP6 [Eubenangee virus]